MENLSSLRAYTMFCEGRLGGKGLPLVKSYFHALNIYIMMSEIYFMKKALKPWINLKLEENGPTLIEIPTDDMSQNIPCPIRKQGRPFPEYSLPHKKTGVSIPRIFLAP
jgi:hypothetical protein